MSGVSGGRDELEAALGSCATGDRAALRFVYEREGARMIGIARRLLRRHDWAEEAVQDTFVLVWQRAATFDPARGRARAWLYAILRHRALNILRGESRTELVEDFEPMNLRSGEESPEMAVERLSEQGRLRGCLERLDLLQRRAVVLAYAGGLTHGELAHRLGVPLGTAKSWIRRSLLALRECMS